MQPSSCTLRLMALSVTCVPDVEEDGPEPFSSIAQPPLVWWWSAPSVCLMRRHQARGPTCAHVRFSSLSIYLYIYIYLCVFLRACLCMHVYVPYRLGFSPQPQKNILVSHSRINPAPWKYLIYTNPAQGFFAWQAPKYAKNSRFSIPHPQNK